MSGIKELTPSSVPHYLNSLNASDMREFRSCKNVKLWFKPEMNRNLKLISQTDNRDAYRNNVETGFGRFENANDGDIIVSNDMRHIISETSKTRVKYRFENSSYTLPQHDCWLLTYKDLQTQVFRKFKHQRPNHTDDLLHRDNKECPCCLEDLTGLLFECENQHQIDYKCFHNLNHNSYTPRKCPVCRVPYKIDQIQKYDAHKDQKITQEHYAQFSGSVVDAELKFCGFLKSINEGSGKMITSLTLAGLHHYLDTSHLPLLVDNKFSLDLLDNESWRNFESYLNSTQYRETLFAIPNLDAPYDYNENMFLIDLNAEYGVEALPKLTEASKSHQDKKTLRFQMYFIHRFLARNPDTTKKLITDSFNSTLKKSTSYRQSYDLIETEMS